MAFENYSIIDENPFKGMSAGLNTNSAVSNSSVGSNVATKSKVNLTDLGNLISSSVTALAKATTGVLDSLTQRKLLLSGTSTGTTYVPSGYTTTSTETQQTNSIIYIALFGCVAVVIVVLLIKK